MMSRQYLYQWLLDLTKELVFFGYDLYTCLYFFPAQEQMSDSEGEDGDDIDIRDLFDEPQIEQNLHELDNDRQ